MSENQETRHIQFSRNETSDSDDVPVGEGQYSMEAKQKSEKVRRGNSVNKEGRDNGEGGKRRRYDGGAEGRVGDEK